MRAPQAQVTDDAALTPALAREWLLTRGFRYTERQVQRMFEERKLPVFYGPCGRRLFVWRSHLEKQYSPASPRIAPKRSVPNMCQEQ
jgi:hypothetical protein